MGFPSICRKEGYALLSSRFRNQLKMMIDFETIQVVAIKLTFAFLMVGAVMTMAGYSVLAERKVSAWMQGRVGPESYCPSLGWKYSHYWQIFTRPWNFPTFVADGLKFLFKEEIVPKTRE